MAEPIRARGRPIAMRPLLAPLALALVLTACGSATRLAGPSAEDTPGTATVTDRPPPIQLVVDGSEVAAFQGSYCWDGPHSGICVDSVGASLPQLPDVGSPEAVTFRFPLPHTTFTAYLTAVGRGCGPGFAGEVVDLGDGEYRLDAAVPAGRYRVSLVGSAPQGEAPGEFVWTSPAAGGRGPASTPASTPAPPCS